MANPNFEAFPTVIALLTSAHISDWSAFSEIIEERALNELRTLATHAIGMLYAATLDDAKNRGQEYLEFISELSLKTQFDSGEPT